MSARRLAAAGVTMMVLCSHLAAAAKHERPTLVIDMTNHAAVPRDDLARARGEVERIFDEAAVAVEWAQPSSPGKDATNGDHRRRVTVLLLTITGDSKVDAEGCALGLAVPSKSTAYVFFNRLLKATRARPVDVTVVLGRVIAHEVGHLLLPQGRHAPYGLMRADLDFGFVNPSGFTRAEAKTIRAALAGTSGIDQRERVLRSSS